MTKYQTVADSLKSEIESGLYKESEKIPSLREIQELKNCSLTTAKEAYRILENEGFIEVKPQSGYYVRKNIENKITGPQNEFHDHISADDRIQSIMRDVMNPDLIPLGAAIPGNEFLPLGKFITSYKTALLYKDMHTYGDLQGFPPLREKIAERSRRYSHNISSDQVLITTGCTEALSLSLQSCVSPGDTVLVPSPTYVGIFQILEALKLKAIEVPYRDEVGLDGEEVEKLCKKHRPNAVIIAPNFNNPNGVMLDESSKLELAKIFYEYNVAVVEDDIYGDLPHVGPRPRPLISYFPNSKSNPPLFVCSSFSKTISPGIRIGWVSSKNEIRNVTKLARAYKISHNQLSQISAYEFLRKYPYERHLTFLRKSFHSNIQLALKTLENASEGKMKIQKPDGGFVLWIKSPLDGQKVLQEAKKRKITIAPGVLFGLSHHWKKYFRINVGLKWNSDLENALIGLGEIVSKSS